MKIAEDRTLQEEMSFDISQRGIEIEDSTFADEQKIKLFLCQGNLLMVNFQLLNFVCNLETKKQLRVSKRSGGPLLQASDRSRTFVSQNRRSRQTRIWKLRDSGRMESVLSFDASENALAASESCVVVGKEDNPRRIQVHSIQTGNLVKTLDGFGLGRHCQALITKSGDELLLTGEDSDDYGSIRVYCLD